MEFEDYGSIPDRPPDRSMSFSIAEAPPPPAEFVRMLEEQGFVFDRTTCPIKLRWPKRMWVDEANLKITYEQWDQPQ